MPARSLASGTISFGLVSIPVKLFAATQPNASISFVMLHAKDGSRLKQQFVCAKDGEKVERDEVSKGYEFAKDQYVTFTTEELKAFEELGSQSIDIAEFVPASEVDPIYFDKAYFVGPNKGGNKAYKLLALALEQSGKAALARYAARGKQYLVLIRSHDGRLVMQQLYYADEVRSLDEIEVDDAKVSDQEVKLALQLIEQTSSDRFEPKKYEDAVKKRVLEAIERKVAGHEIQISPAAEPEAQVIDLMEALKRSLASPKRGGAVAEERVEAKEKARAEPERAARRPRGPRRVEPKPASKATAHGRHPRVSKGA